MAGLANPCLLDFDCQHQVALAEHPHGRGSQQLAQVVAHATAFILSQLSSE